VIQAPRSTVVLLCVVIPALVLAAAAGGFWLGARTRSPAAAAGESRTYAVQNSRIPGSSADTFRTKPGPWGDLECQRTTIEIPDEYLSTRLHQSDTPRWFFKGHSAQAVATLFADAGLSTEERSDLLSTNKWQATAAGIYVSPSEATILSLSPEARSKIYAVLDDFEENAAQNQAFHWPAGSAEEIFSGAELSAETRSLFKRLCYPRGKLVLFADLSTLLRKLPNEAEKSRLEKALSRRPTLLARLVVSPESDVDALARYWGRPGALKDIRPLLEAASRIPEGTKLSILNLLPPWPAARLQSFPLPAPGAQFDCFWSSFNFFKEPPERPTTDGRYWKQKLETEYYPMNSDPRYGDLVMFTRPDGSIIHACVFLADDIVFTKNGANATVPWVLMRIPELLEAYSTEIPETQRLRVVYYRGKNA
jgi:hypothetical protein